MQSGNGKIDFAVTALPIINYSIAVVDETNSGRVIRNMLKAIQRKNSAAVQRLESIEHGDPANLLLERSRQSAILQHRSNGVQMTAQDHADLSLSNSLIKMGEESAKAESSAAQTVLDELEVKFGGNIKDYITTTSNEHTGTTFALVKKLWTEIPLRYSSSTDAIVLVL